MLSEKMLSLDCFSNEMVNSKKEFKPSYWSLKVTSFISTLYKSHMLMNSNDKFLDPILYKKSSPISQLVSWIHPLDVSKSSQIQHDTFEIHGLHSTFLLLPSSQHLFIPNFSSLTIMFHLPRAFCAVLCKHLQGCSETGLAHALYFSLIF